MPLNLSDLEIHIIGLLQFRDPEALGALMQRIYNNADEAGRRVLEGAFRHPAPRLKLQMGLAASSAYQPVKGTK